MYATERDAVVRPLRHCSHLVALGPTARRDEGGTEALRLRGVILGQCVVSSFKKYILASYGFSKMSSVYVGLKSAGSTA